MAHYDFESSYPSNEVKRKYWRLKDHLPDNVDQCKIVLNARYGVEATKEVTPIEE